MKSMIVACVGGLLAAALAATGNVTPNHRGGIPVGEWSGRGVCVYEWWDASAPSPIEEATHGVLKDAVGEQYEDLPRDAEETTEPPGSGNTIYRRYPTTLKIWEARLDGRDVVMFDIRSRRGALPQLGDETHALVVLQRTKRLPPATELYRLLGFAFNPETESLPPINDLAPPCSASCTTLGETTVLQIRYLDDFVDVFRFEGPRLEKMGLYHARGGLIHWTEQLERR